MPFRAKIHKCGFQTRLHTGDLALVYVGFLLNSGAILDIQIVESLPIDERNAKFFFLRCID